MGVRQRAIEFVDWLRESKIKSGDTLYLYEDVSDDQGFVGDEFGRIPHHTVAGMDTSRPGWGGASLGGGEMVFTKQIPPEEGVVYVREINAGQLVKDYGYSDEVSGMYRGFFRGSR